MTVLYVPMVKHLDEPGLESAVEEHVVAVQLEAVLVVDDDALRGGQLHQPNNLSIDQPTNQPTN